MDLEHCALLERIHQLIELEASKIRPGLINSSCIEENPLHPIRVQVGLIAPLLYPREEVDVHPLGFACVLVGRTDFRPEQTENDEEEVDPVEHLFGLDTRELGVPRALPEPALQTG